MLRNPKLAERPQSRHGNDFSRGYYINALLMFILCTHAVITPNPGFQTVMHIVMHTAPFQGAGIAPL